MADKFHVGKRAQSLSREKEHEIGTIKYIGDVKGYEGEWVGVDWESGDGRHNGSVNGVHYFDTTTHKSGSFVRPHTLTAGLTLLQALTSRYKGSTSDEDMYLLSVRHRRVAVELVGKTKIEEKLKHLQDLRSASLAYMAVCSAGPPGEVRNVLSNLQELDLTGNLLSDWHVVERICEELPTLKVLDISENKLKLEKNPSGVFPSLQTLVLNNCGITWSQVQVLKCSFPALEELHLCGNNIKELKLEDADGSSASPFVKGFKSLRLLNLEENCIESWEEILKLAALESLEQLYVGKNKIQHVFYPEHFSETFIQYANGSFKPFSSLRCLLLGGNDIQSWESVDSLNLFPNLTEVRLSDNPITNLASGGAPRYMLVSRLAKVMVLNGSEVKPRERKDAEIRYVRYVMTAMPNSSDAERQLFHPRFAELKALHDMPEESCKVMPGAGTQKMADSLLAVTLVCVASSIGERAPSVKKLPLSTTIGKLKLICENTFKLKASQQCLFLRDKDSPIPTVLNEDMETLGDIGVGMNGTILVDELDA